MNITVYLGAREGNEPVFRETALEVGRWIAQAGHRLIYGGSRIGLMGVLADAAMDGGGEVIATGTPEDIAKAGTYTGEFLERMLDENITPYAKELVQDIGK